MIREFRVMGIITKLYTGKLTLWKRFSNVIHAFLNDSIKNHEKRSQTRLAWLLKYEKKTLIRTLLKPFPGIERSRVWCITPSKIYDGELS